MSKPKDERYTVCVDFDGVIHSYVSPWVDVGTIPDPPVEGAIEWLNEIDRHFDVVIHTTRGATWDGVAAVVQYLEEHGCPNARGWLVTHKKVTALVYLDDRGWRFEGPGTFPTVQEIHLARPWNKERPSPPSARAVFAPCVRYLLARGWYRDGDDLGLWSNDGATWRVVGDALIVQWEKDGVSMQETA